MPSRFSDFSVDISVKRLNASFKTFPDASMTLCENVFSGFFFSFTSQNVRLRECKVSLSFLPSVLRCTYTERK